MKKIFIIFLLILIGCTNPFSTREVNPPNPSERVSSTNSLQTHRDSLLAKLKYSFLEKNVTFYMDCLADSTEIGTHFTFVPQQNEAQRLTPWSRQDEYNYFYNLVSHPDIDDMTVQIFNMQDWTLIGASQDTLQSRLSYEITIDFTTRDELYRGESIFKIVRSAQSLWYIYYWEDLQLETDQPDSSWSTLKANYR